MVLLIGSCTTPAPKDPGHNRPLSAQEHLDEAKRHEREAEAEDQRFHSEPETRTGQPVECFDRPLAGVPHSGGEALRIMRPCWTRHTHSTHEHTAHAEEHLRAAAEHRAKAANLVAAERRACTGLGEEEISHSPFFHREDIAKVEAILEKGTVRGARVTFKPVVGLTLDWLQRAVGCHLARTAVMGFSHRYMAYCPLMLESVTSEVEEAPDGLVVLIRAKRDDIAAAVLGRAQDLIAANPGQ